MHPTIPRGKYGTGDHIMLTGHDLSKPWYATKSTPDRIWFNPSFRAPRGKLTLSPAGQLFAEYHEISPRTIVIEPNIKGTFSSTNKAWPFERWQAVVKALSGFDIVQPTIPQKPILEGVRLIPTADVWQAIAMIAAGAGVVTTEGALHHAAGALRKKAVVVWTAYSDPAILGYDDHKNIYRADPRGLGQRKPCEYCKASAEKITVEEVVAAIKETFDVGSKNDLGAGRDQARN